MRVGVPTEVKPDEYRVALTPSGVRELADGGHEVFVQSGAGEGSAIADEDYRSQGATIVPDADAVFEQGELIVKVKEPQPEEVGRLGSGHTLFTYLHLAPAPELTRSLADSGATCIAYETVEDRQGACRCWRRCRRWRARSPPRPGAFMLEKPQGGRGVLLAGVPGVAAANVLVIGGGVVGMNAAFIAIGMEADVFVFDRNIDRLRELEVIFNGRCSTCYSSTLEIESRLATADLVIGAVLLHGARAPRVITREQLALMKPGAVLVDVSIDQGGCFETSRPTTHSDPTYEVDGIAPLLRDQHARRGAHHLHLRPHQRHPALRDGARRSRRPRGGGRRPRPGQRRQRGRRADHLRPGGRGGRPRASSRSSRALEAVPAG